MSYNNRADLSYADSNDEGRGVSAPAVYWEDIIEGDFREGDTVVVRRARRHTSPEIHQVLFPDGPPPRRSLDELKEGIARHIRERHARR